MMKNPTKILPLPPVYRLTLTAEVFALVVSTAKLKPRMAVLRQDGKWDCAIPLSVIDLIKTEALPDENWNDTIKRMATK